MNALPVALHREFLEPFCLRNHIRRLSLFGSVLTPRFRTDSDVDMLVEFEPGHVSGYFDLARMEMDLTAAVGRTVDLRTQQELSRYFRGEVLSSERS